MPGCSCQYLESGRSSTCRRAGLLPRSSSGVSSASACSGLAGHGSGTTPYAVWQAYWGTGVTRPTIFVQYFGQVVADRDVPWHYPWFYFAVTVPLGLQLLGCLGFARGCKNRQTDAFPLLLAGTIGMFLLIFSTRVPIYDGERLFLHVFPAWALLIGLGFHTLWNHYQTAAVRRGFRIILSAFCSSRPTARLRCTHLV